MQRVETESLLAVTSILITLFRTVPKDIKHSDTGFLNLLAETIESPDYEPVHNHAKILISLVFKHDYFRKHIEAQDPVVIAVVNSLEPPARRIRCELYDSLKRLECYREITIDPNVKKVFSSVQTSKIPFLPTEPFGPKDKLLRDEFGSELDNLAVSYNLYEQDQEHNPEATDGDREEVPPQTSHSQEAFAGQNEPFPSPTSKSHKSGKTRKTGETKQSGKKDDPSSGEQKPPMSSGTYRTRKKPESTTKGSPHAQLTIDVPADESKSQGTKSHARRTPRSAQRRKQEESTASLSGQETEPDHLEAKRSNKDNKGKRHSRSQQPRRSSHHSSSNSSSTGTHSSSESHSAKSHKKKRSKSDSPTRLINRAQIRDLDEILGMLQRTATTLLALAKQPGPDRLSEAAQADVKFASKLLKKPKSSQQSSQEGKKHSERRETPQVPVLSTSDLESFTSRQRQLLRTCVGTKPDSVIESKEYVYKNPQDSFYLKFLPAILSIYSSSCALNSYLATAMEVEDNQQIIDPKQRNQRDHQRFEAKLAERDREIAELRRQLEEWEDTEEMAKTELKDVRKENLVLLEQVRQMDAILKNKTDSERMKEESGSRQSIEMKRLEAENLQLRAELDTVRNRFADQEHSLTHTHRSMDQSALQMHSIEMDNVRLKKKVNKMRSQVSHAVQKARKQARKKERRRLQQKMETRFGRRVGGLDSSSETHSSDLDDGGLSFSEEYLSDDDRDRHRHGTRSKRERDEQVYYSGKDRRGRRDERGERDWDDRHYGRDEYSHSASESGRSYGSHSSYTESHTPRGYPSRSSRYGHNSGRRGGRGNDYEESESFSHSDSRGIVPKKLVEGERTRNANKSKPHHSTHKAGPDRPQTPLALTFRNRPLDIVSIQNLTSQISGRDKASARAAQNNRFGQNQPPLILSVPCRAPRMDELSFVAVIHKRRRDSPKPDKLHKSSHGQPQIVDAFTPATIFNSPIQTLLTLFTKIQQAMVKTTPTSTISGGSALVLLQTAFCINMFCSDFSIITRDEAQPSLPSQQSQPDLLKSGSKHRSKESQPKASLFIPTASIRPFDSACEDAVRGGFFQSLMLVLQHSSFETIFPDSLWLRTHPPQPTEKHQTTLDKRFIFGSPTSSSYLLSIGTWSDLFGVLSDEVSWFPVLYSLGYFCSLLLSLPSPILTKLLPSIGQNVNMNYTFLLSLLQYALLPLRTHLSKESELSSFSESQYILPSGLYPHNTMMIRFILPVLRLLVMSSPGTRTDKVLLSTLVDLLYLDDVSIQINTFAILSTFQFAQNHPQVPFVSAPNLEVPMEQQNEWSDEVVLINRIVCILSSSPLFGNLLNRKQQSSRLSSAGLEISSHSPFFFTPPSLDESLLMMHFSVLTLKNLLIAGKAQLAPFIPSHLMSILSLVLFRSTQNIVTGALPVTLRSMFSPSKEDIEADRELLRSDLFLSLLDSSPDKTNPYFFPSLPSPLSFQDIALRLTITALNCLDVLIDMNQHLTLSTSVHLGPLLFHLALSYPHTSEVRAMSLALLADLTTPAPYRTSPHQSAGQQHPTFSSAMDAEMLPIWESISLDLITTGSVPLLALLILSSESTDIESQSAAHKLEVGKARSFSHQNLCSSLALLQHILIFRTALHAETVQFSENNAITDQTKETTQMPFTFPPTDLKHIPEALKSQVGLIVGRSMNDDPIGEHLDDILSILVSLIASSDQKVSPLQTDTDTNPNFETARLAASCLSLLLNPQTALTEKVAPPLLSPLLSNTKSAEIWLDKVFTSANQLSTNPNSDIDAFTEQRSPFKTPPELFAYSYSTLHRTSQARVLSASNRVPSSFLLSFNGSLRKIKSSFAKEADRISPFAPLVVPHPDFVRLAFLSHNTSRTPSIFEGGDGKKQSSLLSHTITLKVGPILPSSIPHFDYHLSFLTPSVLQKTAPFDLSTLSRTLLSILSTSLSVMLSHPLSLNQPSVAVSQSAVTAQSVLILINSLITAQADLHTIRFSSSDEPNPQKRTEDEFDSFQMLILSQLLVISFPTHHATSVEPPPHLLFDSVYTRSPKVVLSTIPSALIHLSFMLHKSFTMFTHHALSFLILLITDQEQMSAPMTPHTVHSTDLPSVFSSRPNMKQLELIFLLMEDPVALLPLLSFPLTSITLPPLPTSSPFVSSRIPSQITRPPRRSKSPSPSQAQTPPPIDTSFPSLTHILRLLTPLHTSLQVTHLISSMVHSSLRQVSVNKPPSCEEVKFDRSDNQKNGGRTHLHSHSLVLPTHVEVTDRCLIPQTVPLIPRISLHMLAVHPISFPRHVVEHKAPYCPSETLALLFSFALSSLAHVSAYPHLTLLPFYHHHSILISRLAQRHKAAEETNHRHSKIVQEIVKTLMNTPFHRPPVSILTQTYSNEEFDGKDDGRWRMDGGWNVCENGWISDDLKIFEMWTGRETQNVFPYQPERHSHFKMIVSPDAPKGSGKEGFESSIDTEMVNRFVDLFFLPVGLLERCPESLLSVAHSAFLSDFTLLTYVVSNTCFADTILPPLMHHSAVFSNFNTILFSSSLFQSITSLFGLAPFKPLVNAHSPPKRPRDPQNSTSPTIIASALDEPNEKGDIMRLTTLYGDVRLIVENGLMKCSGNENRCHISEEDMFNGLILFSICRLQASSQYDRALLNKLTEAEALEVVLKKERTQFLEGRDEAELQPPNEASDMEIDNLDEDMKMNSEEVRRKTIKYEDEEMEWAEMDLSLSECLSSLVSMNGAFSTGQWMEDPHNRSLSDSRSKERSYVIDFPSRRAERKTRQMIPFWIMLSLDVRLIQSLFNVLVRSEVPPNPLLLSALVFLTSYRLQSHSSAIHTLSHTIFTISPIIPGSFLLLPDDITRPLNPDGSPTKTISVFASSNHTTFLTEDVNRYTADLHPGLLFFSKRWSQSRPLKQLLERVSILDEDQFFREHMVSVNESALVLLSGFEQIGGLGMEIIEECLRMTKEHELLLRRENKERKMMLLNDSQHSHDDSLDASFISQVDETQKVAINYPLLLLSLTAWIAESNDRSHSLRWMARIILKQHTRIHTSNLSHEFNQFVVERLKTEHEGFLKHFWHSISPLLVRPPIVLTPDELTITSILLDLVENTQLHGIILESGFGGMIVNLLWRAGLYMARQTQFSLTLPEDMTERMKEALFGVGSIVLKIASPVSWKKKRKGDDSPVVFSTEALRMKHELAVSHSLHILGFLPLFVYQYPPPQDHHSFNSFPLFSLSPPVFFNRLVSLLNSWIDDDMERSSHSLFSSTASASVIPFFSDQTASCTSLFEPNIQFAHEDGVDVGKKQKQAIVPTATRARFREDEILFSAVPLRSLVRSLIAASIDWKASPIERAKNQSGQIENHNHRHPDWNKVRLICEGILKKVDGLVARGVVHRGSLGTSGVLGEKGKGIVWVGTGKGDVNEMARKMKGEKKEESGRRRQDEEENHSDDRDRSDDNSERKAKRKDKKRRKRDRKDASVKKRSKSKRRDEDF
ncbi:hypothetical protein BLNAU_2255 [Blattamonas nauphoetae]|uniref:Uncharacterized protein n=1 Tax=Blattamonas nauphoetae TaxID=2049346 RepID=A0ABQ9YGG2_9EUKA|nr:hypothetical protein BLNAU_2255 [Blattamonas nauphoetae]